MHSKMAISQVKITEKRVGENSKTRVRFDGKSWKSPLILQDKTQAEKALEKLNSEKINVQEKSGKVLRNLLRIVFYVYACTSK